MVNKKSQADLLIWIRNVFITGLVILGPLALTSYILYFIFDQVSQIFEPIVRDIMTSFFGELPDKLFIGLGIQAVAFFFTLCVVFLVGLLATNVIGKRLLQYIEKVFARIPVVNVIYPLIKQVIDSFKRLGGSSKGFENKQVVFIKYPSLEGYLVGFLTSHFNGPEGEKLASVFIPTAPNPITGFVLVFDESSVVPSGLTMEQAWKMLISAGLIPPKQFQHPIAQDISNQGVQGLKPNDTMQKA